MLARLMCIVVPVIGLCHGGVSATAGERARHAPAAVHEAGPLAADRDPYSDPASPYKANRLAWSRGQSRLDTPGQTTVLTRKVLDDMNATSLRDALRSTAGVTVGR